MIEEERPCGEVLAQLRSAIRALCGLQDKVLDGHLRRCVNESFAAASGGGERERKEEEILALLGRYRQP
jgi:DNA-binding FrmR family transcriptional regulator